MTKQALIKLLRCALGSARCGDDEMLDRCLIELFDTCLFSISEITAFLREQARLRSLENDEAGILIQAAEDIQREVKELES